MSKLNGESLTIVSVEEITTGLCSGVRRYGDPERSLRRVISTDNHLTGTRRVECSSFNDGQCKPAYLPNIGTTSEGRQEILPCVLVVDPSVK